MKISKRKINKIVEYHINFDSGFKAVMIPMPNRHQCSAAIHINKGANMSNYKVNGTYLKPGIAHFLEHRLFDTKKGNVEDLFTSYGASCNAYTNYESTAYYFNTVHELDKCIDLLFDMVFNCTFSAEKVENEKKIIIEELHGILSDPTTVVYLSGISAITQDDAYHHEIVGGESDINSITKDDLYLAYDAFYRPSNMTFIITGRFDYKTMLDYLMEKEKEFKKYSEVIIKKRKKNDIPTKINHEKVSLDINSNEDMYLFAKKIPLKPLEKKYGKIELRKLMNMTFKTIFNSSSKLNNEVINKKLAPTRFATTIKYFEKSVAIIMYNNTSKIEELSKYIIEAMNHLKDYISEEELELEYRANYALQFRDLHNPLYTLESIEDKDDINFELIKSSFKNVKMNYQKSLELLKDISGKPFCEVYGKKK